MIGIFPGLSLFFLQARVTFESFALPDNPNSSRNFFIGIGVILVIAIVLILFNRKFYKPGSGDVNTSRKRFGFFAMLGVRKSYGLNKEQSKLLEQIFRINAVQDPGLVLGSPATLDRFFKRAYRLILENMITDEEAQQKMLRLFTLRNILESAPNLTEISPGSIAADTPAILAIDKDSYSVKVLSSRGQNIITNIPKSSLGTPLRIQKGTKITLSFFTKSSSGFAYEGNITGTINTDFGQGLQITHNRRPKPLIKRKTRRRELNVKCEFYMVNLVETGKGRKKTSKLVVSNKRFSGTILDISIGGCSMRISAQVPMGSRIKLNLNYYDSQISVLGQVLRSNRSGTSIIAHVKFIKVPKRAFNSINSLVFGFDED